MWILCIRVALILSLVAEYVSSCVVIFLISVLLTPAEGLAEDRWKRKMWLGTNPHLKHH